jgi:hypothetical protein
VQFWDPFGVVHTKYRFSTNVPRSYFCKETCPPSAHLTGLEGVCENESLSKFAFKCGKRLGFFAREVRFANWPCVWTTYPA